MACSRHDADILTHQLSPLEQQQQQELIARLRGQLSNMSARCSSLRQENKYVLQKYAEEIEASRCTMLQVDAALDADLRHLLVGWSDADAASEKQLLQRVWQGEEDITDAGVASSLASHILLNDLLYFGRHALQLPCGILLHQRRHCAPAARPGD